MRFAPTASAAAMIRKGRLRTQGSDTRKITVRERVIVIVQKLLAIEGLEALQDPVSNPTSTNGTDNFTLEIKGVPSDVSDFPVATLDHLVSGHEVPDEQEDRHHHVFCDGGDVGPGHFQDLNLFVDSFEYERIVLLRLGLRGSWEMVRASIQIDMITTNTSSNTKFQVLSLTDDDGVGDVCFGVDD